MHKVVVNRLGGLSLLRKSVVRLTDRPDITLDVYRGRKTTTQQQVNVKGKGPITYFSSLTMISTYNTAVTIAASEILRKDCHRKKPWVTKDVLDLCDERRDLKKKRYETEGAKEYREVNRRIQKAVKKAKEDWIGAQCEDIETCLNKNNS